MRYNNRITLIMMIGPADDLHGAPTKTEVEVPCLTIPITDAQELAVYGLLKKTTFEVHLKNSGLVPHRVKLDGIEYTVNKTYLNRKSTVLIISGGA